MNIIQALVQLKTDLLEWATTNFNAKLNKNLGTDHSNEFLTTDPNGEVTTVRLAATKTELDYVAGVTSSIQTQLDNKASDFSIQLYNGTGGNPKPVKFATFNYSSCDSENGIAAKISMVSGHGNGTSYVFLQDVIINVNYAGTVTVDNFKYYGAASPAYEGVVRQYGDIFWVTDSTNKIVDFYCLMGQYSRVNMTPWKRLTYSSGGTVTQHTSCTVYSSGTKEWATNSNIVLAKDLPTKTSQLTNNSDFTTNSYVDSKLSSKASTSHNQAASTITAGTFAGQVVANASGQTPGTSLLRNSKLVPMSSSANPNPTVNGEICWTYK
jgi:hypothetical protein